MNKILLITCLLSLLSLNINAQNNKVNPNGYNKFYYPNGQISSEGTMKNGKPNGYWKTYYPNGEMKSEGNRKNFLLDGLWIFYNENGDTSQTVNYLYGKKNGYTSKYKTVMDSVRHSILISKELYVTNIKQGISYYYHDNGKIYQEVMYKDNLKHGSGKEFNESGRLIALLQYRYNSLIDKELINRVDSKGKKNGVWRDYYANGNVKSEVNYKHGLLDGYVKDYEENGKLIKMQRYINGKLVVVKDDDNEQKVEIVNDYFPDGSVKTSGGFKDNKAVGIHREYDKKGEVVAGKVYSDIGVLEAKGVVDEEGKKQGNWVDYYPEGKIKAKGKYINDLRDGPWLFYFRNGKIEQKGNYKNGLPHGEWIWYYQNGNILREEEYSKGKEEGYATEYTLNGDTIMHGEYYEGEKFGKWIYKIGDEIQEGEYQADLKHGMWYHYYNPGEELRFEGRYVNGNEQGEHYFYYQNGKIKEKREYIMGNRDGNWITYDEQGIVLTIITYKQNKIVKVDGVAL